jgi:uncharacterized protein YkwD
VLPIRSHSTLTLATVAIGVLVLAAATSDPAGQPGAGSATLAAPVVVAGVGAGSEFRVAGQEAGIDLDALIAAHNRERAKEKLPPLRPNAQLAEAAREHARDMAEHKKLSHEGSDGSDPAKRVKRHGYRYQEVGENVADGQTSVEEAMRSWMNSPPHRKNILGDFTEIGPAVAQAQDAEKTNYWCVVFGRPWPKVDPSKDPAAMIAALNEARTAAKKAPVQDDPELARVAEDFAREGAARRKLDTKNREGQTPFDVLKKRGYRARRFALYLASGQGEPAKVVHSWLERQQDREELLSAFVRAGAGVAADEDGVPYWVLLLASKPREL